MTSHHDGSQSHSPDDGREADGAEVNGAANHNGHTSNGHASNGHASNGHSQYERMRSILSDRAELLRSGLEPSVARPVWDRERRELRLGDKVVKRFKWPAENQERVLDAFESQGWPDRISNPLEPHPTICAKRRLHDTLKCLNRKQINPLIKFRGDGTGLGVLLEIVAEKALAN